MAKHVIRTDSAGPPLGAYSQGIRAGDFIFVSGCGPIDATTGKVRGETVERADRGRARQHHRDPRGRRASLADVVKATVHLADETEFPSFNEVYSGRMPEPRPCERPSAVACARCPECSSRST